MKSRYDLSRLRDFNCRNRPAFRNSCDHPEKSFICNFECNGSFYDLYITNEITALGVYTQSVCMRFGLEPHEYISAGPLHVFLICCEREEISPYGLALRIMLKIGVFNWSPK